MSQGHFTIIYIIQVFINNLNDKCLKMFFSFNFSLSYTNLVVLL